LARGFSNDYERGILPDTEARVMTTPEQPPQADRLRDDLLRGAHAIAIELGVEDHQVYYMARKGLLPIGKLGKYLFASRRALRRAAQGLTA
jgi:hypothetical protein